MKILNKNVLFVFIFFVQIALSQSIDKRKWFVEEKEEESLSEVSQRTKIDFNLLKELNTHLKKEVAFKGDTVFTGTIEERDKDSIKQDEHQNDQKIKPIKTLNYKKITFKGKEYLLFEVDHKNHKIEFFNRLQNNNELYSFKSISKDKDVVFVMNGGMYEEDYTPLGLYVSDFKTYNSINLRTEGRGNFYELPPNGIFLIDSNDVGNVVRSEKFESMKTKIKAATQSGPMMVIDGKINSNFTKGSENLNIRNGVGINNKKNVVFVISLDPVNFYEFSELYRDVLKCKNALYLDGVVSQCFIPELHKKPQSGPPLGVYIAVIKVDKKDIKEEISKKNKVKKNEKR